MLQRSYLRSRPSLPRASSIASRISTTFRSGCFIKAGAGDAFWTSIGKTAADFPDLTWPNFIANLVPVTIGNAIGGSLMVGLIYWFIYLRPAAQSRGPAAVPLPKE